MWDKTLRGNLRVWEAVKWPLRVGLPIALLGASAFAARAIVGNADLARVDAVHGGLIEHADQAELVDLVQQAQRGEIEMAEVFELAFEEGDVLFDTGFSAVAGGGANIGTGERYTRVPRADLKGPGQWFSHIPPRPTGPNAAACTECHAAPLDGDGPAAANVIRDPRRQGNLNQFIQRNTPHLFAMGGVQRLAEEMTASLQNIRQNTINNVCRDGTARTANLTVQGVSFGSIRVTRTNRNPCRTTVDTAGVRGVATDLVIRPFQWKGTDPFIRNFARDAMNNELGMQAVEKTGNNVDGDGDGVSNELSIGDATVLAVYLAGQPRPTSLTELANLGLIDPLPAEQTAAINRGSTIFNQIGCASCHVRTLTIANPVFSEPSQSASHRDATFPAGQNPVAEGVDPRFAITFNMTEALPDNAIPIPGTNNLLGSLRKNGNGAFIDLFSDLKRHDLGAGIAEQVDEEGTGASVFLTEVLWGLGSTAPYLHDGRATTITEAILEHGGEAAGSANNFRNRSVSDQKALIAFLSNLVLFDSAEPTLPESNFEAFDIDTSSVDESSVEP